LAHEDAFMPRSRGLISSDSVRNTSSPMRNKLLIKCILLMAVDCDPCFTQAPTSAGIVTDRPDVTESSIVIPVGSVQSESGLTWTGDHGASTIGLPETLFRVGLRERTEVRFGAPDYLYRVDGQLSPEGFGDTSIGLKQQIGPWPGGVDLAVIVAFTIPTGANSVSSHGFDPVIKLPWSRDLKDGWSVGGMQSIFYETDDHRRRVTWEPTFYLEREIAKHSGVFVEYAGDYASGEGSRQVMHFGTAYRITLMQQIDFHFGFGLSHAAPSRFFAAGYVSH
jgi:hypothetical protein